MSLEYIVIPTTYIMIVSVIYHTHTYTHSHSELSLFHSLIGLANIRAQAMARQRQNEASVVGEGDEGESVVGESGEGESVVGEFGEGESVVGEFGEGESVVGEFGEGESEFGEGGSVVGEFGEGGSVVGESGESGNVVGESGEGGSVVGESGESGNVVGESGEGGSVVGESGEGGSVTGESSVCGEHGNRDENYNIDTLITVGEQPQQSQVKNCSGIFSEARRGDTNHDGVKTGGEWAVIMSPKKDGIESRQQQQQVKIQDLEDEDTTSQSNTCCQKDQRYMFEKLSDVPAVKDPREIEAADRALEMLANKPPHQLSTAERIWELAVQGGSTQDSNKLSLDRKTQDRIKETLHKNKLTDKTTLAF